MPVKLNSSGGGAVTLDVPSTTGTFTVNLPAANGDVVVTGGGSTVQFGAGTVSAPGITFTGDTNTGIYSPAADTIAFTEGGVEVMRLNASGNVGIGTAAPGTRLDVSGSIRASQSITIGNGAGTYQAGSIYSDGNWGMICRAAQSSPAIAEFLWTNAGDVQRMRIDTSGNLAFNSGYGSVATAFGCRAWVNFNGTGVVAIRGSGNVSSITDNNVGDYRVNFTTAMPDVNYSVVVSGGATQATRTFSPTNAASLATGSVLIYTSQPGVGAIDTDLVTVSIFR